VSGVWPSRPVTCAEVNSLEGLVIGDETELYADAAYIGPRIRALLVRGPDG